MPNENHQPAAEYGCGRALYSPHLGLKSMVGRIAPVFRILRKVLSCQTSEQAVDAACAHVLRARSARLPIIAAAERPLTAL